MTQREFEDLLFREMLLHRPDIGEDGARELAEATARAVPDTETARASFIAAYAETAAQHARV